MGEWTTLGWVIASIVLGVGTAIAVVGMIEDALKKRRGE